MTAKKIFVMIVALLLALGGVASLKHFYPDIFTPSSFEISSLIEDDSSEVVSSSENSSSIEESSSEIASSEEPSSSSEEIPDEPVVPLPSYLDGEPESEPVDDELNTLTGLVSGYRDQYSTAEDLTGENSRYFGAGIQEASNITSLGWTSTSLPNITRRIPEVNALTEDHYAFVVTNYWISLNNMSISVSWGTTSASTYQALLAVRKYITPSEASPWEILYGPGGESLTMGASGLLEADLESGTDLYQVLFGFTSGNSTAAVRTIHLSIYSSE